LATTDQTRIIIDVESRLRNLERTIRGLDQLKKRLDAIGGTRSNTQGADRAVLAAQKLALQQQRLIVQTQELANRQERVRQVSDRLAQSQQRLTANQDRLAQAQRRVTRSAGEQADAHVKAFRAIQRGVVDANAHVRAFRANEDALRRAPQLDAHVKAFRAIQRGAEQADAHVRAFRANQAALARAPQLDTHVRAFRALEDTTRRATKEQEQLRRSTLTTEQTLNRLGGSLRNIGQGFTSFGATLSVALTAPLAALGVLSTRNAVTLDSLKRGLTAIVGSADEAGRQLTRLTEIAKLPGIGFQEAIQGSIRLQAVGFSAEVAERSLKQFANAVALTGGGREELSRITVQLGQLAAKGKVLAQDLKPIIEAGPSVGKALKDAFGTVNSEDIQALGLTSEQFINKLLGALERLPRAAAGAKNSLENFSDVVFRASAAIGDAILPILTRLIEIAEPIITRLAGAFRELPPSVQGLVVVFGALAAAIGPALFILGQIATGAGGLIAVFGRLATLGLLPTIEGFRLMIPVLRGTTVALTAQQAAAAAAATTWAILAAAVTAGVAVLAIAAVALIAYSEAQGKALDVDTKAAEERLKRIPKLEAEVKELEQLAKQTSISTDEQERLKKSYEALEGAARGRVALVESETEKVRALIEAKREQLRLDQFAAQSTSAQVVKNVTLALEEQRKAEAALADARTRFKNATLDAASASNTFGARTLTATDILIRQEAASLKAAKALDEIGKARASVAAAAQVIADLAEASGRSTETLLQQAKAAGVDEKQIEAVREAIRGLVADQQDGISTIDAFTRAIEEQGKELRAAGDAANSLRKGRKQKIDDAVSLAQEASDSFRGALAFLNAFIAAQPELRAAIGKESQLAGKSFNEFVAEALGGGAKGRAGTSLRNAQEQLAKAVEGVAEAAADRQRQIDRGKNEDLLQQNENSFNLQLIAYEQYLREREFLTRQNIEIEIREQEALHTRALAEQQRFLTRSGKAGLPASERTKALAGAAEAERKSIEAATRINDLRAEQRRITVDTNQVIAEAAEQQVKDIRQLDVEFAELRGSIEDALNTATIERFRERLLALGKAQDIISKQLEIAPALGPEETERLRVAQRRNQSEIDLIELITQQELATNKLAAANEFVRRAKEKQSDLETQLAFEIEFRGLKEEEAIKRRLAGEDELADRLKRSRNIVQLIINDLAAQGVKPPQALADFVRDTDAAIKGLGELPFDEQFRLVEKEFNRINDERIRKIQDVERAVRDRTIAEVEGQIIIRRINNEYTGDLEAQLVLLKQIANASGQDELKRQASDAGETVKDTKDQVASLSKEIKSAGKDALRSGLTDFFLDLTDKSQSARDDLLNLIDSVVNRVKEVIAERLSQELFESLFGGVDTEGIFSKIGRFFGIGGEGAEGRAGGIASAGITQTADATAAATALTTGAAAAATALTSGGATAGAALVTSMTASATAFASSVIAAGAAFAASVAASSAAQGIGGLGSALGAATGIFPATPGGMVRIVEGGYPEAVLTTDPRHAARQVNILRELIQRTRGFYGRIQIPELATGGFTFSRTDAESRLLNSINRTPSTTPRIPDAAIQGAGGNNGMSVRIINQVESRALTRPYLTSEDGVRDILNIISTKSNTINRRIN
jgi:tape measure domain-containing protein